MAEQTPADQQPRTRLDATDPNQTNPAGGAGEQDGATEAPTEQESGGGYGNHAPADQSALFNERPDHEFNEGKDESWR
jgi:hypothetical protein